MARKLNRDQAKEVASKTAPSRRVTKKKGVARTTTSSGARKLSLGIAII